MIHFISFIIGLALTIYGFNQPYTTPIILNIVMGICAVIFGIYPLLNMSHEDGKWLPLLIFYYMLEYWYIVIPAMIGAIILLTHYLWK